MWLQELIEIEATEVIGASRYQAHRDAHDRTPMGTATRTLSTQAGDIGLRIPKVRQGSFFPCAVGTGGHDGAMIFEIPPRWPWTRESELEFAATEGLLAETHYLDLKREVPPGRSHNRELARDLCQFTIDGGTLVIGVEEHAEGPPTLEPVELTGLAERVEQVARSIPDPPVLVTFTTITSERDPAHGYLVVHVPVSGLAPHMVDGVYYGRSDKTKLRLSDAEVMRAHQARTVTEERVVAVLDAYVARDPVPASQRRQAHAFVVAVPVSPHRDMAVPLLTTPDVHTRLFDLVNRGPHHVTVEDPAAPRVSSAGGWQRRGDGGCVDLPTDRTTPTRAM